MHKKQSGGSGQFADVALRFEPGEPGSGFVFKSEIRGGSVPKEYIPGVLKGLEECMTSGSLAGFPVVDILCALTDGSYHEVDSNALAFQIAARGAFREAMPKAGVRLLEPIMKVCGGGGACVCVCWGGGACVCRGGCSPGLSHVCRPAGRLVSEQLQAFICIC